MLRALPLLLVGCAPHLFSPEADTDAFGWEAPENEWPVTPPTEDLVGEGFEVGQVPDDFRLLDQHGGTVALWQFYGKVVALDVSTIWCAPCQELAAEAEATYQAHRDEGFIHVTLITQDVSGDTPEESELLQWADTFALTVPVLADPESAYSAPLIPDNVYPALLVIDRRMRVLTHIDPPTAANLDAAIEVALDADG